METRHILPVIFLLVCPLSAQNVPKIRVKVDLNADNAIRSSFTSYLNRELRSLGDVESVDSNPDYTLHITALMVHTQSGQIVGIAVSTTVTMPFITTFVKSLIPAESDKQMIDTVYGRNNIYLTGYLNTGSHDQALEICREIVTEIDTDLLESDRKERQKYTTPSK